MSVYTKDRIEPQHYLIGGIGNNDGDVVKALIRVRLAKQQLYFIRASRFHVHFQGYPTKIFGKISVRKRI